MNTFSAKGKFLFSGEYLVLEGAKGFASPLQQGQKMTVQQNDSGKIQWTSYVLGELWFEAIVNDELQVEKSNHAEIANRLVQIIKAIDHLNPSFIPGLISGTSVRADMDFDKDWGLGSSATLIAMLSEWAEVNPYALLEKTFGGSGYDLACAQKDHPIFYTINGNEPIVENVFYHPPFTSNMFFVYSGQKSNSRTGMRYFREHAKWSQEDVGAVSKAADTWVNANSSNDLMDIIVDLESRMSRILNMKTIQKEKFEDFDGALKSLGAWGGDFFLAVAEDADYLQDYFNKKNYDIVLQYDQIVHYNPEKVIK